MNNSNLAAKKEINSAEKKEKSQGTSPTANQTEVASRKWEANTSKMANLRQGAQKNREKVMKNMIIS